MNGAKVNGVFHGNKNDEIVGWIPASVDVKFQAMNRGRRGEIAKKDETGTFWVVFRTKKLPKS